MPRPERSTILVVDDEDGIRSLLTDILTDLGYETIAFESGEAAVAAVAAAKRPIALAIVDLVLPGQGGVETLRALRQERPGLAGIISTGYDDQIQADGLSLSEAARLEDFETLAKPYKIDELSAAIERALAKVKKK